MATTEITRTRAVEVAEGKYRALLNASTVLPSQGDLRGVLRSVCGLVSSVVKVEAVALLLLNDAADAARLYAFESAMQPIGSDPDRYYPLAGTVFQEVVESQRPAFVRQMEDELAKIPGSPRYRSITEGAPSYVFPLSSPRKKLGLLIFVTAGVEGPQDADLEFMNSITGNICTLLETALALESAEILRRELESERDRLRLLLEINNLTVTQLDVSDLFGAASRSIRRFFDIAFTGFWTFDQDTNQLMRMYLDFPGRQGFLEDISPPEMTEEELSKIRARVAVVMGPEQIAALPKVLSVPLQQVSIANVACIPLVGSRGPLGIISLGSQTEGTWSDRDLDLLAKVANQIALALDNALAYGRATFSVRRLKEEKQYLESELQLEYNFEDIVGKSPALRKVLEQVSIVAPTDSTVLLIGETGTGKELIARAIHNLSGRRDRTFVRLNCAAVPGGLIESELFGHEKGAFTGALIQKRGRIELAHEGSLFLDEIGDIDLDLQPKLLRVLQEREFERLGSNRTLHVDIRLIAATHRDLPAMARDGKFREDLFYRLNVFPIHIPPLRDRTEDIPLLVHYFVANLSRKMRKSIHVIPREIMTALTAFPWPGNVRELQNFIERSVILSRDEVLSAPIWELNNHLDAPPLRANTLHGVERETIVRALQKAKGKLSGSGGAAEMLGLKRTTLQRKMERFQITRGDYA